MSVVTAIKIADIRHATSDHHAAARQLVAELDERGVSFRVEGQVLRWTAGDGALNVGTIRKIKALQPELIAMLDRREETPGHDDAHRST